MDMHLLGHLRRAEHDSFNEDASRVGIDQDVEGRPTNLERAQEFGGDQHWLGSTSPLPRDVLSGAHNNHPQPYELIEIREHETSTALAVLFHGHDERR